VDGGWLTRGGGWFWFCGVFGAGFGLLERGVLRRVPGEIEFGLVVGGAFDEGVDDVGLVSLGDLLAHEGPDLLGTFVAGAAGDDGGAAGREFVDDADFEVAVDSEGEGAGDGGCGHDEDVGVAAAWLLDEGEALADAEAVLLVDDDEAKVGEVDLFLNECLGADDEFGFAAQDAGAAAALGGVVERAGEQGDVVVAGGALQQLARGDVVLRREDFRRCHEHGLIAVFDGDECGFDGDDGLAAADVALQKAAHGAGLAHVFDDFAEDALLCGGGAEGKDLLDGGADVCIGGEGDALAVAQAFALEFEAEFEVEELLEDEALLGGGAEALQVGEQRSGGWEVGVAQGLEAGWEAEAAQHGDGEDLFERRALRELFEDLPEHAARPLGAEFRAPGGGAAERLVDGDNAADFEHGTERVGVGSGGVRQWWEEFELGLDHLVAAGLRARRLYLAVERDHLTELELVFEVGAAEPHGLEGLEAVADGEFEEGHGAGVEKDGAADFADDGGHLAGNEFVERLGMESVFVAEGEVVEQVVDGAHAAFFEGFGVAWTDALEKLHGRGKLDHSLRW